MCLCVWAHTCHEVHVELREQLAFYSGFFLRLGNKRLYPLSHLPCPIESVQLMVFQNRNLKLCAEYCSPSWWQSQCCVQECWLCFGCCAVAFLLFKRGLFTCFHLNAFKFMLWFVMFRWLLIWVSCICMILNYPTDLLDFVCNWSLFLHWKILIDLKSNNLNDNNKKALSFYVYLMNAQVCACAQHTCSACGGQKKVSVPGVKVLMRIYVGVRKSVQVPCKNSKPS